MNKYNVKIDLWGYFDNVEAESEKEAIFKTLVDDILYDYEDFIIDYEKIVERLLDKLQNSCYAEIIESEEE